MKLRACHCCGLVHCVGHLRDSEVATCLRCGSIVDSAGRSGTRSAARCFAATLGALILYPPAVLLPIVDVEQLGHHHATSLLGGTRDLLVKGEWFVGLVILAFSILLPLVKLILLLELSFTELTRRKHRAWTYRFVEWAGRWSMLDVLLLALLVAGIKLGDLVNFAFGPAVVAFTMCVLMSMLASIMFDPHAIWEVEEA